MEITAKTSVRISTRKVRLAADSVRKLSLEEALRSLSVLKKRGAVPVEKTLKSAIANAVNNNNLKQESLMIKSIEVFEMPSYKRFHPSTRGRVHPYKRRGSHVKIVLTDNKDGTGTVKPEVNSKKKNVKESETEGGIK